MNRELDGDETLLLELEAMGGTIRIVRWMTDGKWKYIAISDDRAKAEFLEMEDPDDLIVQSPPVESFTQALRLLEAYPWQEMTVVSVHPEVEEEVRAAMRERKKQSEEGEGEAG